MQQLEAERFKRKGLEDRLAALAHKTEEEVFAQGTAEDTSGWLKAEISLVDTAIAECELGLEGLQAK